MSLFAKLQSQATQVKTEDTDRKGKFTVDSDAYKGKIKAAYIDAYTSGALFVALDVELQVNGKVRQYKEQINISNKEGSLTYEKNGETHPLPGYVMIDTICKCAAGIEFGSVETENKMVKVFNKTTRQEEPTMKEVITSLMGTELVLGIQEIKRNHWDATKAANGETITENKIDKVFTVDGTTLNEAIAGLEAKYIDTWTEANKGQVRDMTTAPKATAGRPAQAGAPARAAGSLFGNRS